MHTSVMFTLKCVQSLVSKSLDSIRTTTKKKKKQELGLSSSHFNTGCSNPNPPPHYSASVWS